MTTASAPIIFHPGNDSGLPEKCAAVTVSMCAVGGIRSNRSVRARSSERIFGIPRERDGSPGPTATSATAIGIRFPPGALMSM